MNTPKSKTRRQKAVAPPMAAPPTVAAAAPEPQPIGGKLGAMAALLRRAEGATIALLVEATGWKEASVRGALAGALKTRGLTISSDKADGVRTYCVRQPLRVEVQA